MVASNSPSGFWFVLLVLLGFCLFGAATRGASAPVILDTDIGDDIGDTWRASGAHPHAQARLSIRPYEKSEWRHGLAILGCRNVLIQDLTIEQTGGDGIYLGAAAGQIPNRQVTIRRVDCNATTGKASAPAQRGDRRVRRRRTCVRFPLRWLRLRRAAFSVH